MPASSALVAPEFSSGEPKVPDTRGDAPAALSATCCCRAATASACSGFRIDTSAPPLSADSCTLGPSSGSTYDSPRVGRGTGLLRRQTWLWVGRASVKNAAYASASPSPSSSSSYAALTSRPGEERSVSASYRRPRGPLRSVIILAPTMAASARDRAMDATSICQPSTCVPVDCAACAYATDWMIACAGACSRPTQNSTSCT
mmetsp:Transcript_17712/g.44628  ORF Transcript_17712/g.44628 Transcript_17712/m.44628 type:complete len:202 (-) Transcript_17712:1058-1663(-)